MAALLAVVGTAYAAAPPPPGAASCSGCHARHEEASSAIPGIFGRDPDDVVAAMKSFRDGARSATVMNRIAKGFSDDELRAIAAWLAAQK
jgi:cytochrome subunit of sulfide dehydrogenase